MARREKARRLSWSAGRLVQRIAVYTVLFAAAVLLAGCVRLSLF
jgi:hypothetical protein